MLRDENENKIQLEKKIKQIAITKMMNTFDIKTK